MSWNRVHIVQFLLLISLFKESLSDDVVRLPKHLTPINYNLTIIPNFDEESLDGIAIIQMTCLNEDCQNITLHARDIRVDTYTLTDDKGKNITIESMKEKKEENLLVFNLTEKLNRTSNYSFFIRYHVEDFRGIYFSYYEKLYYTTIPLINARSVFPCFDEPEFKATFDLTLARKPKMHTLSNMPHKNNNTMRSTNGDLVFDEFKTTPNMSTHVLAFHISTFSYKTAPNISNVDIKMWAPDKLLKDDNKILQKVGDIYKDLERYLNYTQPINKQDLVYSDADEHVGANSWGIISFSPYEIYIGNKSLPYTNEKNLIDLAHKLSHQWLGNLVTPSWWSDLWVSEGTSTFMSYFVQQEEINKIWNKFSLDVFQEVLRKDSKKHTLPLKHEVINDLEYVYPFLDILSEKGACITRMMMKTFGDEVFKKGIQYFLKEFSFKNVEQDDLWKSIQKFVDNKNVSVKKIMSGWTTQSGYPLVIVKVSKEGKEINIRQKQFFDDKKVNNTRKLWRIPLKYQVINIENQTVVDRELKHIEKNATTKINDTSIGKNTLVIANVELLGFFRVNYDKNNWKEIIKQLRRNHSIIHVLNRAQFMDDAFSLVGPSIENYTLGMRISQYLVNEKEELPWLTFLKYVLNFYEDVILSNRNSTFMKYLKNITKNTFKPFKLTEMESLSSGLTFDLKTKIANWACLSGNEKCNKWAEKAFDRWKNDTEKGIKPRKMYKDGTFLRNIACSKLKNNADNATLEFFIRQQFSYGLQFAISCVEKEEHIHLILNRTWAVISTLPAFSLSPVGRKVMREVLRNVTNKGELLSRSVIYNLLTSNLERSLDETEFNQTKSVFVDIVNWPQFNTTILEPEFNISAIKNHTEEIRLTWLYNKAIEQDVINVVT